MDKLRIRECYGEIEMTEEHSGYYYSVGKALTIAIMGSICGIQTTRQIHQWAVTPRVREFLKEHFGIYKIPSYYWLLCLLSIIKLEALNQRFTNWVTKLLPEALESLIMAFDGKTVRSTGKMEEYEKPLHILSAHIAELGLTVGQKTVSKKSNEIPAMRELINLINIHGCIVVADALHCQTETAEVIVQNGGDYLLCAKGNQEILERDIEEYVQDSELRANMETDSTREKNGGRIEFRQAFVSYDTEWIEAHLQKWAELACFGAINRQFTGSDGKTSNEWHYYISSRKLSPDELLKYARNEWSVESMHWMLDVHFDEDSCGMRDKTVNEVSNILRKISLNTARNYKNNTGSKLPVSRLMFGCLLDCERILEILNL